MPWPGGIKKHCEGMCVEGWGGGGEEHLVGDPWSQTASSPEVEDRKEKNPNHLRKDVFIYLSAIFGIWSRFKHTDHVINLLNSFFLFFFSLGVDKSKHFLQVSTQLGVSVCGTLNCG